MSVNPPTISNRNPGPGSISNNPYQVIGADIVDPDGDLLSSGIDVYIDEGSGEVHAYDGDGVGFIAPYDGPLSAITAITNGFTVEIQKNSNISPREVTVRVVAADASLNTLDTSWSFNVTYLYDHTLWASQDDADHAYSFDKGKTWTTVNTQSLGGAFSCGIKSGPKNKFKFYSGFSNSEGVQYFDGEWHDEYTGFNVSYTSSKPQVGAVWCNEDDTVVLAASFDTIRGRRGPPGTAWTTERTQSNFYHIDVHGTPDGSVTAAIARYYSYGYYLYLYVNTGIGWVYKGYKYNQWPVAVRVISATEIYIFSYQYGSPYTYNATVDLYNGSGWSQVYYGGSYRAIPTISGVWMAEDGSEGWMATRESGGSGETEAFIYFDGAAWALAEREQYDSDSTDIAQLDGDPSSAICLLKDRSLRRYDGANWDPTLSGVEFAPVSSEALYLSYVPHILPVEPYFSNQSPVAGSTSKDPYLQISLDVLDWQGDLDASTINVYINDGGGEVLAYQAGVGFSAPYNGGSSAVTVIPDGRNIVFDRTTDYPTGITVTVRVTASDTLANSLNDSYTFDVTYVNEPYLENKSPEPSAELVPVDTLVNVDILDAQENLDLSTLNIYVDDGTPAGEVLAYQAGVGFVAPYNGASSSLTALPPKGQRAVIERTTDWAKLAVTVRVNVQDTDTNTLNESWSFTITPWRLATASLPGTLEAPLGDAYLAGEFTFAGSGRNFYGTDNNAPAVYEALSTYGLDHTDVMRLTGKLVDSNPAIGTYVGGGILFFNDDRTDALTYTYLDKNTVYTVGAQNGGTLYFGSTYAPASSALLRIYWNGSASPFTIQEAAFGSWVVAAGNVSYWYSLDNGVVWTRMTDQTIPAGVEPTRAGIVGFDHYGSSGDTATVSDFDLSYIEPPEPLLDNQDPTPGSSTTDANALISVDVIDYQGDLDLSTLNITVDPGSGPAAAYTAGVGFVAPYDGGSSALTPIANGYTVVIDNTGTWLDGDVTTRVTVSDLLANSLDESWTFTSIAAPYIENQTPAGRQGDPNILISVDVVDPQDDLDVSTLNVTIDEGGGPAAAYTGGVGFVAPYNGPSSALTPIANGYTVTIDNTNPWAGGTVTVRVTADDLATNSVDESFSFSYGVWTIWVPCEADPLAFSFGSSVDWQSVPTDSIGSYVEMAGFWGPRNLWKFYGTFSSSQGVWYYGDDDAWHSEFTGVEFNGPVARVSAGIWCDENDTLVVAVQGYSVYARPGLPGTSWVEEFNEGFGGFVDVHGTPDGLEVFAIQGGSGYDNAYLLRRSFDGTWSQVASVTDNLVPYVWNVRVVSATEVYFTGLHDTKNTIWKWDGSDVTVAYEEAAGGSGIQSIWVGPDGSEGWAISRSGTAPYQTVFVRYDGVDWTSYQTVVYSTSVNSVTQYPGDPTTGIALLYDRSLRRFDGSVWDDTVTGTEIVTEASTSPIGILYFENGHSEPYIANRVPAPESTEATLTFLISVDVLDYQDDVDASTINVYVNDGGGGGEVLAYQGGVGFVAPYDGGSSALTPVANGYTVVLDRTTDYPNDVDAAVRVTAADTGSNTMDEDWSFSVYFPVFPYLDNQNPKDVEVTDPNTLVSTDVLDPQGNLDLNTLNITIDLGAGPVAAYTGGVGFVSPFDGVSSSLTPTANGYTIVIDYTSTYTDGYKTAAVTAEDTDGNPMSESWSWYQSEWTVKFSGVPTLTQIDDPANVSYATGTFTIDTNAASGLARAYVETDNVGASRDAILRLTVRVNDVTSFPSGSLRGKLIFWGPEEDSINWTGVEHYDAIIGQIGNPDLLSSDPVFFSRVIHDDDFTYGSQYRPTTTHSSNWLARFYWNGSDAPFTIPEPGFGGRTLGPGMLSLWYSKDDGITWRRWAERDVSMWYTPEWDSNANDFQLGVKNFHRMSPDKVGIEVHYPTGWGVLNVTFSDFEIAQIDPVAPYLANRFPAPEAPLDNLGSTEDGDTLISCDILDFQGDLDISTLYVTVNGDLAYQSGSFVSPFDGAASSLVPITGGYTLTINRTSSYSNESVTVRVQVSDTAVNSLDDSWLFNVFSYRSQVLWASGSYVPRLYGSMDFGSTWVQNPVSRWIYDNLPRDASKYYGLQGLAAPHNEYKVYFILESIADGDLVGLYYYDGDFHLEDLHAPQYIEDDAYDNPTVWCNEDDTLVCVAGFSKSPGTEYWDVIRSRPGPPGTPWVTEFIDGYASGYFSEVRGLRDGSAVYATRSFVQPDYRAELLKRSSGGVWSVETFSLDTEVYCWTSLWPVSETEVWIIGSDDSYEQAIWKWDGATLTKEWTSSNSVFYGMYSIWMSQDGTDGLALASQRVGYEDQTWILRYSAGTWSVESAAEYDWSYVPAVTQLDEKPDSGIILTYDGRYRKFDGVAWDQTLEYEGQLESDIWGLHNGAPQAWSMSYFGELDSDPPYLANLSPYDGEVGVFPDGSIFLDVLDDESGVKSSSVLIKVNGDTAWEGEQQQSGFSVTKTVQPYGLRYVINLDRFLPPGITIVEVYAEDLQD